MGYRVENGRMNAILEELSSAYNLFGPAWDAQKKRVIYREIRQIEEIVTDRQSDFSAKAAYYPVSQVLFSFRDGKARESAIEDGRGILIFARPCDIHAIRRQDALFLQNGGTEDLYYKRLREKVRFALLECREGFEHCFCVSLGTNQTEAYDLAIRIEEKACRIEVREGAFESFFRAEEADPFTPAFVKENKKKLRIPAITRENMRAVSELPYWNTFDEEKGCIACGGCNTVCGTCTCFDTVDILDRSGSNNGERRRIWSGCMLANFTETAGGARSRKTSGANMRFKIFHKFFDYRMRFGEEDMCVGCGRCDMRCPKGISFFDAVTGLHDLIEKEGL